MKFMVENAKRFALLAFAVIVATSVLVAHAHAGKNSSAKNPVPSAKSSALIDGSVGGTLVSGKWKLEIPAGAFNGSATISMLEAVTTDGSPTVDLSISDPALNSFRRPVWLSHTDSRNKDKSIYWWDPVNLVWCEVPGELVSLLDALNIELKVPLFHFSIYSVRGGKGGW